MRAAWWIGIFALSAWAAPQSFTGEGNAVMTPGREAQAQQIAIDKATDDALAKALGREEPSLAARARELILSSRVTGQSVDGNIVNIEVELQVDPQRLRQAFPTASRGTSGLEGGRRVLVLAAEQLGPAHYLGWTDHAFGATGGSVSHTAKSTVVQVTQDMGACEAAVADAFVAAGFEVVDPSVLAGKVAPRSAAQVLSLSNPEAQKLAGVAGADLVAVVTGRASLATVPAAAHAGMLSGQGSVVARLVRVKDGRVLATATRSGAQLHIDGATAEVQALSAAAKEAAVALLERVSTPANTGENGP